MSSFVGYIDASDVNSAETFATYCQQRIGIPYPTQRQMQMVRHQAKILFDSYPQASWQTMVRVADWCCNNRRRFAHTAGVFSQVRHAWAARYLPELDPVSVDESLEEGILAALAVEKDEDWRRRLILSSGDMRRVVYKQWASANG